MDHTILLVLAALVVGLGVGAMIAGIACMARGVCLRLPQELHCRLSEAAMDHERDLKAEIISRLTRSFEARSRTMRKLNARERLMP